MRPFKEFLTEAQAPWFNIGSKVESQIKKEIDDELVRNRHESSSGGLPIAGTDFEMFLSKALSKTIIDYLEAKRKRPISKSSALEITNMLPNIYDWCKEKGWSPIVMRANGADRSVQINLYKAGKKRK